MRKKTIPSEKNPTKLNAAPTPKECNDKGDIRSTDSEASSRPCLNFANFGFK